MFRPLTVSLTLVMLASPARAQDAAPTPITDDPPPVTDGPPSRDEEPKKAKTKKPVIVGRIFMRDTVSKLGSEGPWRNDPVLISARLAAEYEPTEAIKFVLEVELAEGVPELKDAYVRLRPNDWFEALAGNFKRPISAVGLESIWTLPVLDRGLLNDLRVGDVRLPLGARSEGLQLSFSLPDVAAEPTLRLALMRSLLSEAVDVTLDTFSDFSEEVYARVEAEPVGSLVVAATIGAVPYMRTTAPDSMRNGFIGGIDATLRTRPIDLWAEAFSGRSPLLFSDGEGGFAARGDFRAARVVAAPRVRRPLPWLHSLQPFVSLQMLEPSTSRDDDRMAQVMLGANLYYSRDGRVQIGLDHTWAEAAAPTSDRTAVAVQLAAVF